MLPDARIGILYIIRIILMFFLTVAVSLHTITLMQQF